MSAARSMRISRVQLAGSSSRRSARSRRVASCTAMRDDVADRSTLLCRLLGSQSVKLAPKRPSPPRWRGSTAQS
eukprot:3217555-Prymnesium_polylepis.1